MIPLLPIVPVLLGNVLCASRGTLDDGWDLMLLEAPRRVVLGDPLELVVRCRPGRPYLVFVDTTLLRHLFRNAPVHLSGASTLLVALGNMAPNGTTSHSFPTPALPELDGRELYFQAFNADSSIGGTVGASTYRAVRFHADDQQPVIRLLTVNRIPSDFNGSERNEGTLVVPPTGFTVDLVFDARGRGAIDPASLVVTSNVALANGTVPAGTNLAQFMTITQDGASGIVDSTWAFPANTDVTLTADVRNVNGRSAPRETYRVRAERFTTTTQPFEVRQLWFLDFDWTDLDGSTVPDYREDLVLYGLGNDARASSGPTAHVAQASKDAIVLKMREIFRVNLPDGVNVDFRSTPPATVHARICIGGRNPYPREDLPPGAQETTGAAYLNPRNQRNNIVNCGDVLGVHPRSIFHLFRGVPEFVAVFGPLQGNPVGNDPDDAVVTVPGWDPATGTPRQRARWAEIRAGIDAFVRATSFVLTQETCHSMGLVEGGILPTGQLGGEPHGGSTSGHTDDGQGNYMSGNNSTPAPATAENLAMIWGHFQSGRAHFTPFNWAYLRQQVIHK